MRADVVISIRSSAKVYLIERNKKQKWKSGFGMRLVTVTWFLTELDWCFDCPPSSCSLTSNSNPFVAATFEKAKTYVLAEPKIRTVRSEVRILSCPRPVFPNKSQR